MKYLAIWVQQGLIGYIDPISGEVQMFAQRGLDKLTEMEIKSAIELGILSPAILNVPAVPSGIKLEFEEPKIQGKVQINLPISSIKENIKRVYG